MEISVIVPVYNVKDKLERCINSILNQTFTDFELLLIDDGSTDCSLEICNKFLNADERVIVFSKENGGVSIARNTGLGVAKGKYVVFIDSDDFVDSEYLEVLYNSVKDGNSQLGICGVKVCAPFDEKQFTPQINEGDYTVTLKNNGDAFAKLLNQRRFNYVYSKIFVKEILDKFDIKFDTKLKVAEDTEFVLSYLKRVASLSVVGKSYYNYIKYQSGTLTSTFNLNNFSDIEIVNYKLERLAVDLGAYDNTVKFIIDARRLSGAYWTIELIAKSKERFSKKVDAVDDILNAESIQKILNGELEKNRGLPYYVELSPNNAKKICKSIIKNEAREKRKKNFKIFIYKITPPFIKKWRRKCKNNAQ